MGASGGDGEKTTYASLKNEVPGFWFDAADQLPVSRSLLGSTRRLDRATTDRNLVAISICPAPERQQVSVPAVDWILAGCPTFGNSRERCFAIFTACAFLIRAFRRIGTRPARRRASPYLVGTSGRGVAYGRTDVCAAFLTKSAPIFFQGPGGDGRDQDFKRRLTSWTVSSLCSCRQSLARFQLSINQREASSMNSAPRRCLIASRVAARVLGTGASFRAGSSDSGWNFCASGRTAQIPADWLIIVGSPNKARAFTTISQEAFGSIVTGI